MKIGRLELFWCGLIWYSKPYISIGGYNCKMLHTFGFIKTNKYHDKKFGYWMFYYDMPFHNFGLFLFQFFWYHLPKIIEKDKK